jgi:hypothetical protein
MAVAADAMLHAVPQLDLILTPNGFGIVNNQNIVPASKERVDRLLAGLEKLRDDALTIILSMLPAAHQWTDSEQFRYFADTMFADLDTVQHPIFKRQISISTLQMFLVRALKRSLIRLILVASLLN